MAMSRPTISSDIGETIHIIKNGENGFLAKTKEEFAARMEALIKNADLRERIGRNARKSVEEKYSLSVLGRRLYEILSQINA